MQGKGVQQANDVAHIVHAGVVFLPLRCIAQPIAPQINGHHVEASCVQSTHLVTPRVPTLRKPMQQQHRRPYIIPTIIHSPHAPQKASQNSLSIKSGLEATVLIFKEELRPQILNIELESISHDNFKTMVFIPSTRNLKIGCTRRAYYKKDIKLHRCHRKL
jgi:hypothetical protein